MARRAMLFFALAGDDDDLGQPFQGQQIGQSGQTFLADRRDGAAGPDPAEPPAGAGGRKVSTALARSSARTMSIILRQRPLHLRADFLVVINNQAILGSFSLFLQRQKHAESSALSQFAFDFNPAPCASTIILL